MPDDLKKKIKVRKVFFSIFLVLTIIFLIGAIIGGIIGQDDIIPTMAIVFGILCTITLILTIIFGAKFRRLVKETGSNEN
ncbi:MAG: hypothetical protein ACTSO7_11070 [Candidatus Heimdallarchaeota archaeon]